VHTVEAGRVASLAPHAGKPVPAGCHGSASPVTSSAARFQASRGNAATCRCTAGFMRVCCPLGYPRRSGGSRGMRGSMIRVLVLAFAVVGCSALAAPPVPASSTGTLATFGAGPPTTQGLTIVSITFDDGIESSYASRALLAAHGMHATFYLSTGH